MRARTAPVTKVSGAVVSVIGAGGAVEPIREGVRTCGASAFLAVVPWIQVAVVVTRAADETCIGRGVNVRTETTRGAGICRTRPTVVAIHGGEIVADAGLAR